MSDKILRALMHLFAIIAKVDEVSDKEFYTEIQSSKGRKIVEGFLKSELSSDFIHKYLLIFENHLKSTRGRIYSKNDDRKRTSLHSVKILRICSQINKELTQRQKIIVLTRIVEFINLGGDLTERETKFAQTVSDAFHIDNEEFIRIKYFLGFDGISFKDVNDILYYCDENIDHLKNAITEVCSNLDAPIIILYLRSVRSLFIKYSGTEELYINGQLVSRNKAHIFNVGSTVKTNKSGQIYYSDVISKLTDSAYELALNFGVSNVIHSFKSGENAIQKVNFSTNAGKIIGLMGASGSGKTTLINIMNGKTKPKYGNITINGIDLYANSEKLKGIIGNVSQADLLIEELSVFENLFFSAKLSIRDISKIQLYRKINKLLKRLGLYEIRNLRVGSAVSKVISGGQRKRLNIALELIREPSILFVDEPTSGLSSKDSDNIMDLLKELALGGKLIFTVIHQPSSTIFKLFDRLLILDDGGFLIYDGTPLNSIIHFKTYSFQGNAHENECMLCGNVNPELIFNIIDAKIVDEFGGETNQRKSSAQQWNKLYQEHKKRYKIKLHSPEEIKRKGTPSSFKQFFTYFQRDFFAKKSNKQYLIINALVSPILAVVLSFFTKYYSKNSNSNSYSYYTNENIPQYIFIAVIVSIFIGMIVSAEEINRDKKILLREKFISLSRSSYLLSKIAFFFIISALQSLMFVAIGNSILEIQGMFMEYWLLLFSISCLSNMVGLNISSTFNTAKVIYIFVPLVIIPQLLFSGVIVKFDKLHPSLSHATEVPIIGNIMPSRWAYEALIVEQTSQNKLSSIFLNFDILKSQATWKKDYWLPKLQNELNILTNSESTVTQKKIARELLTNEIKKEDLVWTDLKCESCIENLSFSTITEEDIRPINVFLSILRKQYIYTINTSIDSIRIRKEKMGIENYRKLRNEYTNEALENILTNKLELNKTITLNGELYQNSDPIYNLPQKHSFFTSHFYSPYKYIFGSRVSTFYGNLMVIWGMVFLGYFLLYFDVFKKLFSRLTSISLK